MAQQDDQRAGSGGIAFRYMTRFACIGAACEDHCCTGSWRITVDEPHYKKLKNAMDRSAEERQRFRDGHQRLRGEQKSEAAYAVLTQTGGNCSFLDADGLCAIHRRYGEALLSNTCATYPRSVLTVDGRPELTGTLSCPEVARRCLLDADAMELVDAPELPRRSLSGGVLTPRTAGPYERYLDDIRAAGLALLSDPDHPAESRLFFLAYFGKELDGILRRDTAECDESRLAALLARLADPATLAELDAGFQRLQVPGTVGLVLVDEVLTERLRRECAPRFRDLVQRVAAGYAEALDGIAEPEQAAALLAAHESRRAAWQQAAGDRLDQFFVHYAINTWMREPYVTAPSLGTYVHGLLTRIAVLRFLLLGHPELAAVAAAPDDERRATLDRVSVEVFYSFARSIEHNAGFLRAIRAALEAKGLAGYVHAVMLAKF